MYRGEVRLWLSKYLLKLQTLFWQETSCWVIEDTAPAMIRWGTQNKHWNMIECASCVKISHGSWILYYQIHHTMTMTVPSTCSGKYSNITYISPLACKITMSRCWKYHVTWSKIIDMLLDVIVRVIFYVPKFLHFNWNSFECFKWNSNWCKDKLPRCNEQLFIFILTDIVIQQCRGGVSGG